MAPLCGGLRDVKRRRCGCERESVHAAERQSRGACARPGKKTSPSRFPFRPPFSLTFPFRVQSSSSASTYSGSVLGARENLGGGQGPCKGAEGHRSRNLRKFNFPHFHSKVCSLWITQGRLLR